MQEDGKAKKINVDAFCAVYFSKEHIMSYSLKEYSFFFGYLIHLLTDIEWNKKVLSPSKEKYAEEYKFLQKCLSVAFAAVLRLDIQVFQIESGSPEKS